MGQAKRGDIGTQMNACTSAILFKFTSFPSIHGRRKETASAQNLKQKFCLSLPSLPHEFCPKVHGLKLTTISPEHIQTQWL